jgi:hypothetical protein
MELSREDIYREWLGIKCPGPSYYGLLGLPELELDPQVIQHAGRRVKRKLRAYQIGPYRKQALDLLAEVGQAVAVLTSEEKRAAYDRDLRGRWKSVAEELYRAHCDGASLGAPVLETWLGACVARGVPVTRVLPAILRASTPGPVRPPVLGARTGRRMGANLKGWPPHGAHQLALPVGLLLYRDAVILGQCLHIGSLERRAEAVKHIQQTLGVPEGLARLVAEEVSRSLHLFARSRFVAQAKRDPEAYLVRLGRRVHRYGGHLGRRAGVLVAVAGLLGVPRKGVERVFEQVAEPAARVSAARKAARAWRGATGEAKGAVQWFRSRPQVAVVVLALGVGMAVLSLAVLVASGVWNPWKGGVDVTAPPLAPRENTGGRTHTGSPPGEAPPLSPPVRGAKEGVTRPVEGPLPPVAAPTEEELQSLEGFIKKYPSGKAPAPAEDDTQPTPGVNPPGGRRPGGKTPTFFSVPAERAPDKTPSKAPETPAPK